LNALGRSALYIIELAHDEREQVPVGVSVEKHPLNSNR
jgi:hypothetical protein